MTSTNGSDAFHTPIVRYYVDTRPHAPISVRRHLNSPTRESEMLPLIETLPKDIQDAIGRYVRKPDRYMSLASALLKYLFIHKTAKIPWSKVKIDRTPKPHSRPYWKAPNDWSGKGFEGLEFNVSHQAGMIVLVGCVTPDRPRDARIDDQKEVNVRSSTVLNPDPTAVLETESEINEDEHAVVRIGVDIACTWEPPRTPDLSTQQKFEEWVDVFTEMFSIKDRNDMKHTPVSGLTGMTESDKKTRRFYTYWALKEAYIKMVGEGLLAPWLQELEFRTVPVPPKAKGGVRNEWTMMSEAEISRLGVLFRNKNIADSMHTTLEGFEDNFLIATMTRGVVDQPASEARWEQIDLFGDVRLCATEKCQCLA